MVSETAPGVRVCPARRREDQVKYRGKCLISKSIITITAQLDLRSGCVVVLLRHRLVSREQYLIILNIFAQIYVLFEIMISAILLILANDPGKCPTAKICSANFLLIALG